MKKSHPCFQRTTVDPETNEAVEQCTFPVEVDYLVQDTIEPLRPKLQLFQSLQEAQNAVTKIEKELLAKLAKVCTVGCFIILPYQLLILKALSYRLHQKFE